MAHTCNRCRTTYESGAFYSGHDYCMSCYVTARQEEEQKKRREEAVAAEAAAKARKEIEKRIVADSLKRRSVGRGSRLEEGLGLRGYVVRGGDSRTIAEKKKKEREEIAKRKQYDDWKKRLGVLRGMRAEKEEQSQPQRARHRMPSVVQVGQEEGFEQPASSLELVIEGPNSPKRNREEAIFGRLELAAKKSLPVSLSIGQKGCKASFAGSNLTSKESHVRLFVSIGDENGKAVECKAVPQECTIAPNEAAEFEVEFDLGEDCARGRLKMAACMKEKAVYLDAAMGRSNTVEMGSNVKTPMQLVYREASAKFIQEEGAILLEFDNVGESGGILSVKSSVTCEGAKAALIRQAKVKGFERKIALKFAPVKKECAGELKVFLAGADANGKGYLLEKSIKRQAR